MRLYSAVFDDVLVDPHALRAHALGLDYKGEVGPDGVTYPNISADVPDRTRAELAALLGDDIVLTFFRLSLADTTAPHWAHTDKIISTHLALLYLTLPQHCVGGTAIVEHRSGMRLHPQTEDELALWRRDTNNLSMWHATTSVPMRFNRLAVLPSDVFHAATPQGFGSSVHDGRLVLITFFNTKE